MNQINSMLVGAILLIAICLAIHAGRKFGLQIAGKAVPDEYFRTHVNGVQSSMLAILGLMLGFTFSLALQRFDDRSRAVGHEAAAIETSFLRAQLLPEPARGQVLRLLRHYIDLRVEAGGAPLEKNGERDALLLQTRQLQGELWQRIQEAAAVNPDEVPTGMFIESVNAMYASFNARDAEIRRHVPDQVLLLLFATFILTGFVSGYATAGLIGGKFSITTYLLFALVVIIVTLTLDLDQPRRGFIRVDQHSMLVVQEDIAAAVPLP
jgi:hypothetical protein